MTEWQNVCTGCGFQQTTQGGDLPGQCPRCKGWSWCCRLLRNEARGTSEAEIAGDKASGCVRTPAGNLSQSFQHSGLANEPEKPQKRRGPRPLQVDDLVRELAGQGLSSRLIAERLQGQGLKITYKTVQRRLQGTLLS